MASCSASGGQRDQCAGGSPRCSFTDLPYEIVVAIVGRMCLPDTAAAAASGALLAVAAREALAKRLASALVAAGIKPCDDAANDGDDGVIAHYVALHNAIALDDPMTAAAVLGAGVITSLDAPMPSIETVPPWVQPVVAVFAVTGDHQVCTALRPTKPTRFLPCHLPNRTGAVSYQLNDDREATRVWSAFLPRGALQQTPLVQAVRCASRRVVRALLAAGARTHPSPEALLACAMDRLADDTVLLVRHRRRGGDGQVGGNITLDAPQHRAIDGPGIVDDLLRAFPRTPPPIGPLDVNPLSCLRGALYWAKNAYRWDQREERADGPLSRFKRVVSALLAAGYSPDERISLIPQDCDMYGHLATDIKTAPDHGDPTCSLGPFAGSHKRQRTVVDITERQAATAIHDRGERPHQRHKYASGRIFSLGLSAICSAYGAVARSPGGSDGL
ncbi:hypothetical protein psal_cds_725 [Pandoravirus salinus]|uniref:Uncharacterized protein n=1 Tax=Pandoravirus salinus TaxID=1349410 RepID=S4W2H5_9VIRU|nr:hypothetical protein psal_cds_725 [Pandoravirus salinus]AGO84702.1 hypothetical protein psal_cds_725 [Pandoravirus salinus]